jgi:hypothetical protein
LVSCLEPGIQIPTHSPKSLWDIISRR